MNYSFYKANGDFSISKNSYKKKNISIKTILGLKDNIKVILVNTISHKSNILLYCKKMIMRSTTGDEFKNIIKNDPHSFDIAILYSANYSSNDDLKYFNTLHADNILKNKIYHYNGGIYEWAQCSCLMPKVFKVFSLTQKKEANIGELKNIVSNFSHSTSNDENSDNKIIQNAAISGKEIYSNIFQNI
tara:strand:- start:6 stop:569 length:564 start_codon:yes stop_codon:yes gene_type:complete